MAVGGLAGARLATEGLEVPLAGGTSVAYLDLDAAASTPPMRSVLDALAQLEPWYSSVHRGAGFASVVFTRVYEAARRVMSEFVGASPEHALIFTRNTTDAINCIAGAVRFRPGDAVLTTAVEHHADLLPWRRHAAVVTVPPPPSPGDLVDEVERRLRASAGAVRVVAVTGASNVTGEVFPIAALAELAHRHDALLFVDAAQLAPHRAIAMTAAGVDCLALSGHKMYAPFGAGALVAPVSLLGEAEPFLAGGGAVNLVTLEDVSWKGVPDRHEAGTPNVLGAAAMAAAATTLRQVGMDEVADHERRLLARLLPGLDTIPGLRRYRLWDDAECDRVGVVSFNLEGLHHTLVAAALSAEHGIGVRSGCFCAQPYLAHLLGVDLATRTGEAGGSLRAGAVRVSCSVATTTADVDRLLAALGELATRGPSESYAIDPAAGEYRLVDDPRPLPSFGWLPDLRAMEEPGGCDPGL